MLLFLVALYFAVYTITMGVAWPLPLMFYSCTRLGLVSLAYLWKRDQKELLQEMIESKVHAVLIKVAAMGKL